MSAKKQFWVHIDSEYDRMKLLASPRMKLCLELQQAYIIYRSAGLGRALAESLRNEGVNCATYYEEGAIVRFLAGEIRALIVCDLTCLKTEEFLELKVPLVINFDFPLNLELYIEGYHVASEENQVAYPMILSFVSSTDSQALDDVLQFFFMQELDYDAWNDENDP